MDVLRDNFSELALSNFNAQGDLSLFYFSWQQQLLMSLLPASPYGGLSQPDAHTQHPNPPFIRPRPSQEEEEP